MIEIQIISLAHTFILVISLEITQWHSSHLEFNDSFKAYVMTAAYLPLVKFVEQMQCRSYRPNATIIIYSAPVTTIVTLLPLLSSPMTFKNYAHVQCSLLFQLLLLWR